jgi:bacterioferritin
MRNDMVIKELNTLLRGTFMGIRSYEHYIQEVEDEGLKKVFQSMQKDVKENAVKIAERIQNLGGVPADDEGISGSMQSCMHKLMLSDDSQSMVEDAINGLDTYGVRYSEELVKGDLDPESRKIAEEVIDTSRRHSEQLKQMQDFLH